MDPKTVRSWSAIVMAVVRSPGLSVYAATNGNKKTGTGTCIGLANLKLLRLGTGLDFLKVYPGKFARAWKNAKWSESYLLARMRNAAKVDHAK